MLSVDLVRAIRRQGVLKLQRFGSKERARAEEIAQAQLELVQWMLGERRADVQEALSAVEIAPREKKLADGLQKLLLDRCTFGASQAIDPARLRATLFQRAAIARAERTFDRARLIEALARELAITPQALEEQLYADLRHEQRLTEIEETSAHALVHAYALGQSQAILLRAERLIVTIRSSAPADLRALFRALKFRRLLFLAEPQDEGVKLIIDGPMSLFGGGATKYGMQLALVLPAIRSCGDWAIEADLRWGKNRERTRFEDAGKREAHALSARLPEELEALEQKLNERAESGRGKWRAARTDQLFFTPGHDVCVPDLVLHHEGGAQVFLEALGFWNRDAVFRRVDLVRAGELPPILFAVPQRLRVSEKVLDAELPASMLIYKSVISAKSVESAAEAALR